MFNLACPFGFPTSKLSRLHSAAMRPLSCLAGNQNYGAIFEHLKLDMTLRGHLRRRSFAVDHGADNSLLSHFMLLFGVLLV
jgi:hypothetical protein